MKTYLSPLDRIIKSDEPEKHLETLSYTVESLIATARLALDNETSGSDLRDRCPYVVEETLSVAQALMGLVSEAADRLAIRQRKEGKA